MNYKELQIVIETTLAEIADKYDLEAGAFTAEVGAGTLKISYTYNEHGAVVIDDEQRDFNHMCATYGFKPTDYERLIEVNGKYYKFIGFNPKARKNFCIFSKDGRMYAQSIENTRRLLDN